MHYVTEDELRLAYAREPFYTYELPPASRLTPSARQFLIDFRIDFESADKSSDAVDSPLSCTVDSSPGNHSAYGSFCDDVAVLGAELRLVGVHALGIENEVASLLDTFGTAWQQGIFDAEVGSEQTDDAAQLALPPLGARVHPLYFELSLAIAQIARMARFWEAACAEMPSGERAQVSSWLSEACHVRTYLLEVVSCIGKGKRCD